jgi:transcription initiation factor TFIIB
MVDKTKKIKKKINKNQLWNSFKNEINKNAIECLYSIDKPQDICHCCESILMINDEGFLNCSNKSCGIVYKDIIDHSAEWRYYGADDSNICDPTRAGPPINPLLRESSFGCKVMCNTIASYEMRKIKRYSEWQSMPYKEKSQYDEFQRITLIATQGGIPKIIIDDALKYHKLITEKKTFRGLNRDGIIAASIYIASRINNYPRTIKEIATIFHLDNTSATRGCKNAISIINDSEFDFNTEDKTLLCNTTPSSFIERYCSKLNINNELTKLASFIAIRIINNNLIPENTPHSIAAGIVYFVSQECNLNVSKQNINSISGISEVTINKCYKKLLTMKDVLIPTVILDKYN